mmetsp:Transcript_51/g.122  ORF Transcript_51/g.122 Transcript_51/m.122 type:complete len:111 (+) Transcript_51:261-593(+)
MSPFFCRALFSIRHRECMGACWAMRHTASQKILGKFSYYKTMSPPRLQDRLHIAEKAALMTMSREIKLDSKRCDTHKLQTETITETFWAGDNEEKRNRERSHISRLLSSN